MNLSSKKTHRVSGIRTRRCMPVLMTVLLLCTAPGMVSADKMNDRLPQPNKRSGAALTNSSGEALVQVALLLDTSGSMKGLVDQARCQLWNVVSDLATAQRDGKPIRLQIAVYQFGTEDVSKKQGCLRQIIPFTETLDDVSAGLFRLTVAGGDEYCGEAVGAALDDLDWSSEPSVYKAIFIAGNESFYQGERTFGSLLPELNAQSILVNTIYCGSKYKNDEEWRLASQAAEGRFTKIDHNHKLPDISTPYDQKMRELNSEMNETFVWYGSRAKKAAENQARQDRNADRMSDHAFASRMSAKIGHLYHHIEHDLIDGTLHGKIRLETMPEELMPESLRSMTPKERQEYLSAMISLRQSVRRRMAEVIAKRHRFLTAKMSEKLSPSEDSVTDLGEALISAVTEQARQRGYEFEKPLDVAAQKN